MCLDIELHGICVLPDHNGAENQQSSSPLSSPFQSEEDTEPGLVITLGELSLSRKKIRTRMSAVYLPLPAYCFPDQFSLASAQ